MKVAFLSPLPPARSGVAHYASMVLPALRERVDVTAFGSIDGYRSADFDVVIYQLGNNPHHEFVYHEAMRHPGVAVLHDVVLHHLIVEMTLARGDAAAYVAALEASHGEEGAAWARGRAAGLHSEMGNFLFPASIELARRSRAVIVHNRWAADLLRSFGIETPIFVVPHPYVVPKAAAEPKAAGGARVIGLFGFLTSAKRGEVVLEAFREARAKEPRLQLLIAGEPAPNIDITSLGANGVTVTGYVADEDFDRYYAAADRLVNLRYPSAGETSGTLIRAFVAGKPVAVSDYAQFAELPDDCVVKIPFGEGEVEALAAFFLRDFDAARIAAAQREWLTSNAAMEKTVEGYLAALGAGPSSGHRPPSPRSRGEKALIGLFPRIGFTFSSAVLTVRNDGDFALRARVYGEPAYRLVVKFFDGEREVANRWIALEGDLRPGEAEQVPVTPPEGATTLRVYHALEGIPLVDPEPAAEIELARV